MEKRFGVISADGHCRLMHLPFDLWTKRLPSKSRDDGPQIVTNADGVRRWVVEGHDWSGVGWAGTGRGAVNCYTRHGIAEEVEPGIFRAASAKYRCEDMDTDGVDAELVNGPYEQLSQIKNPELRAACVAAVNDWAREVYEESGGRFIMLLPLPCMTPEEATAELYRVAKFGMPTGVIFDWTFAPEPVIHQQWEPVWAAAAETGMPVNFHAFPAGGSRQIGVGVQGLEPRPPPGHQVCHRGGRGRVGPVCLLALRPRIRFWRAGDAGLRARHSIAADAEPNPEGARLFHV
jgi:hypothetical protein